MPFRVKDVLIVNATVIIGLLILLTFQSISSSFIETETSNFNKKWRDLGMQMSSTFSLLDDCKLLNDDRAAYEDWFLEIHTMYYEDGSEYKLYDHLSKEMEDEIQKNCAELTIQSLQEHNHLMLVEEEGFNLEYLAQMDSDGNIYTSEDVDFDYDWTMQSMTYEESDYFRGIVTGPFYVNIINVVMILPFTASAIIASFNAFRKNEETNKASRAAVFSMGAGFCVMIVGFLIILYAFHQVYTPFL
mgnify:CR=1 FL=1